ncbi:glycosyltransferase family 2 protein [Thomasclavelia cocleata]|uniref:glycosyltransferase family 2 protein n=1 Tax=Thomasclavelia cocleata TaxID=69824 RepID=UPI00242AD98D|nr:glycosyltransferase family 2 protein [Thomasclavelia cocleata]
MKPLLSIIVPAYNSHETYKRCLNSIYMQDFKNYEVIIVDDGSKDSFAKELDDYCRKKNNFKVIHTKNNGVSSARNLGIKMSIGKYLMFLDSDDYILNGMLKTFVDAIHSNSVDIVIGGYMLLNDFNFSCGCQFNNEYYNKDKFWNFISLNTKKFGYICSKIYKLNIIKNNHILFNENMYSQEDLDFNLSYYYCCQTYLFIDSIDYIYDFTPSNRKPDFITYIKNQIKLYFYANEQSHIDINSFNSIYNRIENLIYCYLYDSCTYQELKKRCDRINCISGIYNFFEDCINLNNKVGILKFFYNKQFLIIYLYIKTRKLLGRLKKLINDN